MLCFQVFKSYYLNWRMNLSGMFFQLPKMKVNNYSPSTGDIYFYIHNILQYCTPLDV